MDRIRLARAADAPGIAALQAESWRATYRGFLPDAYLDREVFEDRTAAWSRRFGERYEDPVLILIAEDDGAIVGFAHSYVDDHREWARCSTTCTSAPTASVAG